VRDASGTLGEGLVLGDADVNCAEISLFDQARHLKYQSLQGELYVRKLAPRPFHCSRLFESRREVLGLPKSPVSTLDGRCLRGGIAYADGHLEGVVYEDTPALERSLVVECCGEAAEKLGAQSAVARRENSEELLQER
jgi:hypothetical protein